MSSNMPASLANGRYQLGQLVGRGGMAEVRVALDTRLGRTVAIKIMRADLANDKIFLSRFRREAHSVAQMNNPNIVNIYDSGEETVMTDSGGTERLPYLVMEFVKGQTLRDVIKANGPLSQRDAEQVMLGVLNALEYSHHMGIVHRDIKPGNIMISEQGVVKVMDFGIARALDDSAATMTQSQGVVGTAQYLSPEQARGETVDMRSDLYSAGCVLYEMLTGRPPFTGDSAVAIAYQHVSEVATPPSTLVPGLPRMWDSICAKAMAKDRQNRYATAAEFKNDILTFMNGGVPVAAAFNPLTDLANVKARKAAEQQDGGATVPMSAVGAGQPTQAYNPATGQFEMVPPAQNPNEALAVKSRAEQRAEAARQKRKKKIIIASIISGVVLLAIIFGVIYTMSRKSATEMGTVPTITATMTKAQAKEKVTSAGFNFVEMQDSDSGEPAGTFTKQSPEGDTQAVKGSDVKVWFSVGPKSVTVPDLSDYTQDGCAQRAGETGLQGVVRHEDRRQRHHREGQGREHRPGLRHVAAQGHDDHAVHLLGHDQGARRSGRPTQGHGAGQALVHEVPAGRRAGGLGQGGEGLGDASQPRFRRTGAAGLADHGLRVHRQAAGQRAQSPRQHDRQGQGHAGQRLHAEGHRRRDR